MSEDLLDQGERFFRELADNAPVMIWRSGVDKRCNWFNKPWLDFVGRTMEQEFGNGWVENVHADDVDRCLKIYTSAFDARKPFSMVYRLRRSDGIYREILDNGAPFYREGDFAGYFGSCIDVTDQRLAEEQLRQAQKLEAIGQLTGGIAHDFNNLLTAIITNLYLASQQAGESAETTRFLRAAQAAAESGASLIRQLLAFARKQRLNPRSLDLARLIAGLEEFLRRTLGSEFRLVITAAGDAAPAYADANQVELAILNLVLNARDAMAKGGSVRVAVENRGAERGSPELAPGEYVVVSVSDDGIGMDEATLARAFEPFFTTKEAGRGSGLGLPMVQGFAMQSGGDVRIRSALGKGTTVELWLPRADKPALDAEDASRPAGEIPRVAASVLLCEDDDHVREALSEFLQSIGYSVQQATSGEAALRILDAGAHVDLLIADNSMPGITGLEAIRQARARRPDLRTLLITGRAAIPADDVLETPILVKPFAPDQLAHQVADILAA